MISDGTCDNAKLPAGIVNLEEWPTFYEDMQEDLEKYCSKFGEVLFVGAEKKLGSGVARRVNDHDMAGYICVY